MGRNRVLSFMSQFSSRDSPTTTSPTSSPPHEGVGTHRKPDSADQFFEPSTPPNPHHSYLPSSPTPLPASPVRGEYDHSPPPINHSPSASPQQARPRSSSRPLSMVQAYQPPTMDLSDDTIPELLPIFTFLNSHANKLYQEGYFLKLDDQNSQGRPNPDRTWTECFAQLVGTVLSLWDAADLDAAGEDGEVLPKFVNLTDASIKMIESLPTRSNDDPPLQNILSISTAGRNRYLLHFNSHHSLVQWTAGIRLSMFEHSTLQEAYTGALIAGKGKQLNNINLIMERARVKNEEWVRVRFGAGVPWRRCWCVINPPDEKEYQKMQKDLKKKSVYDRSHAPILKGDIKFYDTKKEGKKQKKAKPIASITEAYSAYAIYPQAKSLIDASTLVKIEGNITIHSDPPSATEGFVFIMPEVHPAVSGFEMLLRFLFPTWDTFALYGRPGRLVASVLDPRSLMFAMPKHKRYGYLEILDVTGLINDQTASGWTERDWRKKMKELTGERMNAMEDPSRTHSRAGSRSSKRLSMGPGTGSTNSRPRVNFADDKVSVRSSRSMSLTHGGPRTDSAPPAADRQRVPSAMANVSGHARNASDTHLDGPLPIRGPPGLHAMMDNRREPSPPVRGLAHGLISTTPERNSSEDERPPYQQSQSSRDLENFQRMQTPEPVHVPPAFAHGPSSRPAATPYHSPELRRANSRLSSTTLAQLAKAGGVAPEYYPDEQGRHSAEENAGYRDPRDPPVHPHANSAGMTANSTGSREALTSQPYNPHMPHQSSGLPPNMAMALGTKRSKSPLNHSPLNQSFAPPGSAGSNYGPGPRPGTPEIRGNPNFGPEPGRPPFPPHDLQRGPPPGGPGGPAQPSYDRRRGPPPGVATRPPPQGGPPGGPQGGPPGPYPGYGGRGGPMPPPHSRPPQGPPPYGPPPHVPSSQGRRTPPPGAGRGGPLPDLNTSPPINRKPLPQRTTSLQRREDEQPPLSTGSSQSSLRDHYIDESVLDRVHPPSGSARGTPLPEHQVRRQATQRSEASSNYDDASSTASPDYASTRKSSETQASFERPRAGVLKTVGDVDQHPLPAKPDGYDIPQINFGPTLNYGAPPRNKTPTPLNKSPTPGAQPGRPYSPGPARKSPDNRAGETTHFRTDSEDTVRRSVAWQPGGVTIGTGGDRPGAVSPEQYVQQRAAAATTPLYSHQRSPSGNVLGGSRNNTPTPPLKRNSSYDMLSTAGGHSRSNSADLLGSRPNSQGAGATLGGGSGDVTSHLSAREQEHLAKMTGAPLISMASNNRTPQSGGGLVGAIAAREREKQQMKDGVSSQAVQQAINQRQMMAEQQYRQQQQQYIQQQQQAHMYGNAVPMGAPTGAPSTYGGGMGGMNNSHMNPNSPMSIQNSQMGRGGFQLPPGHGPPQSRSQMGPPPNSYGSQQGYNSPAANVYAQGGGWSKPGPRQGVPQQMEGQFVQSPQQGFIQSPSPHGQHSPGSPRPGTPGSMGRGMMYQGQGQAF